MRRAGYYITLSIIVLALTSCTEEINQEDLIISAVEIRIDKWKMEQIEMCKEKAMMRAETYVDSLLLVTSLDAKLDTIPKPGKPEKPQKPTFRQKPDSVVVKPIYKKDQ